jgi:MFS family permease
MLAALRVVDFRFLLLGNLVSNLGSWLLVVAVPYHVFQLTGSTAATGLTLAAESVPALVAGPLAGVFVDRWDLRRVMISTDVLSAVALIGIPLADRPSRLGWLYVALLVESLGMVFFRPAARALLPAVVGTGPALAGANSLIALNNGVIRLAGPPLGAVALTWLGLPALVLIDLASYLVSALAIALTGYRRRGSTPEPDPGSIRTVAGVVADLLAGLRFTAGHRTLRGLLLVSGTFFTANAVFTSLLIPFMTGRFGNHPGLIGAQLTALGGGYLLGGPLAPRLLRGRSSSLALVLGPLGVGGCFAVLANAPTATVAVLATGASGLPGSLLMVTIETTIQRATPDRLRGRTGAVFFASDAAAALIGALIGAVAGGSERELPGQGLDGQLATVLTVAACVILLSPLLLITQCDRLRGCSSIRWILPKSASRSQRRFAGQRPNPEVATKSPKMPGI